VMTRQFAQGTVAPVSPMVQHTRSAIRARRQQLPRSADQLPIQLSVHADARQVHLRRHHGLAGSLEQRDLFERRHGSTASADLSSANCAAGFSRGARSKAQPASLRRIGPRCWVDQA
jgi:hypothetical protein